LGMQPLKFGQKSVEELTMRNKIGSKGDLNAN